MFRHHDVHLYLAHHVDPADQAGGTPAALLSVLRQYLGSSAHPVHWVLSPGMFEHPDPRIRDEMKAQLAARMEEGRDVLVARGHRGALHPLMALADIEHDLAWAVRNRWKSGVADVLGRSPTAVYPPCPDWSRDGVPALYRRAGYLTVLLRWPEDSETAYTLLGEPPPEGPRVINVLRAVPGAISVIRAAVRRGERSFALVMDGAGLRDQTGAAVLAHIEKRYHLSLHTFAGTPAPGARTGRPEPEPTCLPCSPTSRHRWLQVPETRKRGAVAADALMVAFGANAAADGARDIPKGDTRPAPRTPDSAMPGDVILSGPSFDARFVGGVLRGLRRGNEELAPLGAALPYVRMGPRIRHAEVEGATSFDDGARRGLRTSLGLDDGEVTVDAWFPQGGSVLALEILARYPDAPDATEIVPFGLRLDLGSWPAEASPPVARLVCRSPDGATRETTVQAHRRGVRSGLAVGTWITIHVAGKALTLCPARGTSCRPVPWRIETRARNAHLVLNPLGTYRAAETAAYRGIRERATLLVSPGAEIPVLKAAALKKLLPDIVERV